MKYIAGTKVNLNKAEQGNTALVADLIKAKINWQSDVGVWCTCGDICKAIGIASDYWNVRAVAKAIKDIYPNVQRRHSNGRKLWLIPGELIEAEQ